MRLASLVVVVLAFGGASAGSARPLDSLRLVLSVAWLEAEPGEVRLQPAESRVRSQPRIEGSERAERPHTHVSPTSIDRSSFQRPPPADLRAL
jgi:hypothetical protein